MTSEAGVTSGMALMREAIQDWENVRVLRTRSAALEILASQPKCEAIARKTKTTPAKVMTGVRATLTVLNAELDSRGVAYT